MTVLDMSLSLAGEYDRPLMMVVLYMNNAELSLNLTDRIVVTSVNGEKYTGKNICRMITQFPSGIGR